MEPPVEIQVQNDEEGKRDALYESCLGRPDILLQGNRKQNGSEAADTPCLRSSSSSSSCSVDAEEEFTEKRSTGSAGPQAEFDAISHFMRGRKAKLKEQNVIEEPRFTSRDFEKHPTKWKPWPPSKNTYVGDGGGYHRPLHQQRSTPEEMLRLRNRECWDFFHPRKSGKIHLRSVSFPRVREKCANSCGSTTSFGTLTTVASSFSGSSVFSCFTRRHTDLAATLNWADPKSSSAAERTVRRSQISQARHSSIYDLTTPSCDELPPKKAPSAPFNASLDTSLSSGRSHTSVDKNSSKNPFQRIFGSIQESPENFQTVGEQHLPFSQPDCGRVRNSGSSFPLESLSSQSSTAFNKTRESFQCTDASLYSTSQSLLSFNPNSAHKPASSFTTPLSASRPREAFPREACSDRPFQKTGEETPPVQSQLAGSRELCTDLGRSSALPCSGSSADGDAPVAQTPERGDCSVQRTPLETSISGGAHPEQPPLAGSPRPDAQEKAELRRCPNAPHLSYVSAPITDIPELILGDGILVPPAVGNVLTDAKKEAAVDEGK